MWHLPELDLEVFVELVPSIQRQRRGHDAPLVDHVVPRRVRREETRHRFRAVYRRVLDAEAFVAEHRQPRVVADVGVRQENAVEGTPFRRASPKRRFADEIDLTSDIRRRVNQIEALRLRLDQRERRDKASIPLEQ